MTEGNKKGPRGALKRAIGGFAKLQPRPVSSAQRTISFSVKIEPLVRWQLIGKTRGKCQAERARPNRHLGSPPFHSTM